MSRKAAKKEAAAAKRSQEAAWARWQETDSAEDMAAWSKAVDDQRAAEDRAEAAADRWEANEAERESCQADWWVAAVSNARCVA